MSLRIIKPGILDTIQDMGRFGYRHLGINPGGVMDQYAAQIANCLVGNPLHTAVIEVHFPASAFFFEEPVLIAITGGDFAACINGDPVPSGQPLLLGKYSILQFERLISGARAYVSVYGGFEINQWLGSASTNLKAGAGGYEGRSLQANDEIPVHTLEIFSAILQKKEFIVLPWKADIYWQDSQREEISILPGHEWDQLTGSSKQKLLEGSFTVSSQSDRMGYRLTGDPLAVQSSEELVSAAVDFGTLQLLPDGQLILLMADHQTSGGYPRIAHAISVHHSKLAQTKPGEILRFRLSEQATAEELFMKQQQHLAQLQNACKFRLEAFLHL